MSIVGILLVLVIVGVCLYLVQTYVPMAQPIKTIITVVVVLLLVVWLLEAFGIVDGTGLDRSMAFLGYMLAVAG